MNDKLTGVLTISMEIEDEEAGSGLNRYTWVLNKQAPNKQIWLSSPFSGPMRFEYSVNKAASDSYAWCSTRTGKELTRLLYNEIETITKVPLTE